MLTTLVTTTLLALAGADRKEISISAALEPSPALRYRFQADAFEQRRGDAVQMYMQVALLLSRAEAEQNEEIAALLDVPLSSLQGENLANLELRYDEIGELLHIAARTDQCHWDIPIRELGIATLLPELGSLRQAARVLAAHARLMMSEGDFDGAIRDIESGMVLGRNLSEGPTLIHALVGIAVQSLMLDRVEELSSLEGAPNLYWAIANEPRVSLEEALRFEAAFIEFSDIGIRDLDHRTLSVPELESRTRSTIQNFTRLMGYAETPGMTGSSGAFLGIAQVMTVYPAAKQSFIDQGMPESDVAALPVTYVALRYTYDDYTRLRDDIFKWFSLPYWDARVGLARAESSLEAEAGRHLNPFVAFLPALSKARESQVRIERAMDLRMLVEALRHHVAKT
ncbi:MAG: hypothetical protein KDA28_05345, partial [Phycisphaerales bacterium]|nr:hypothetical protein [Phycisphaerales bacterium]